MRLVNPTITAVYTDGSTPTGVGFLVSALTDIVGASFSIQYKVAGSFTVSTKTIAARNSTYSVEFELAYSEIVLIVPSGMSIEDVVFDVRLIMEYGGRTTITPWIQGRAVLSPGTPDEQATTIEAMLYPPCTSIGDITASMLPSWMSMARSPGIFVFTATASNEPNDPGNPDGPAHGVLVSDQITDIVTIGGTVYYYKEGSTRYTVAAAPAIAYITAASAPSGNTITIGAENVAPGLVEGIICYEISSPDIIYTISDVTAGVITVDRTVTTSLKEWCFETQSIALSDELPAELITGAEFIWCFDTVGRRLIEAIDYSLFEFERVAADRRYKFSPQEQSTTQTWFGHKCVFNLADIPEHLMISRDTTLLAGSTLGLLQVESPFELLYTPAPCYINVGSTLVFNHLSMIQEDITTVETIDDDGITTEITLGYDPIPGTNFYVWDLVYGWTILDEEFYTIDGRDIVLEYGLEQTDIILRYEMTTSTSDPYAPFVEVNINNTALVPQPHQLWNTLDDIGLFIGTPRFWIDPTDEITTRTYESNTEYKTRLLAAATIIPGPTKDVVRMWLGIRLGTVSMLEWDGNSTLTLPDNTTHVYVDQLEENEIVTVELMRSSNDSERRYYFQEPPTGDVDIYVDSVFTEYVIYTDDDGTERAAVPGEQAAYYYIKVDAATWERKKKIVGAYQYTNYTVDLTAPSLVNATNLPCTSYTVFAIESITTNTFDDEDFRDTLIDDDTGLANSKYRDVARQLLDITKITSDRAVWGRSYWFSHDEARPELSRLPTQWI